MKLSYEGEHGVKLEADHPDERIRQYFRDKIKEVIEDEIQSFLEEVSVSFRQMEPGQKKVLKSRPITVTLQMPKEEEKKAE